GGERSELLRHHERGVVGQHDSAGADPYPRRTGGHVGNRHGRRGTGDAGHVVMLREPKSPVTPPLRVLREVARIVQGLTGVTAVHEWRQIEKRIRIPPPTVLRLERSE